MLLLLQNSAVSLLIFDVAFSRFYRSWYVDSFVMKRSVWNVGNNKKKGSWKQATVGLMLFHCDYAETTIIIIIVHF